MFTDADLEMAEMAEAADRIADTERSGLCVHDAVQHLKCRRCGMQFHCTGEWLDAIDYAVEVREPWVSGWEHRCDPW